MNHLTTTLERPVSRALPFGGLTDAQLLKRFLGERDEAAFEVLVWRYGPMVLRVGVRVLRDLHSAEDVFQATFFTLATKARTIGKYEAVSSWLYQVAYRLALRARSNVAKHIPRKTFPIDAIADTSSQLPADDLAWRELGVVIDREIQKLPEKLRVPFVLCYLQGKTNEQAAEELGCPKGTVLSRLSRARERLRKRLSRRGLVLSASILALLGGPKSWASAAESIQLVEKTMGTATGLIQHKAAVEIVPSRILNLMKGITNSRGAAKRSSVIALLLLMALGGIAAGIWAYQSMPTQCSHGFNQTQPQGEGSTTDSASATSSKGCSTP
ncbi:MAG TPA: sigma-70 family RNA polymerase sigma factor [Gemmataceae bacterium]|jgi:RNA polymerase sigma factor (sigma-70 family)|nr:sigma-70 family RNA polymerase sigma factor [Gemmataceae bacterium]